MSNEYYYNEGQYENDWTSRTIIGEPEFSKEATYLEIKAEANATNREAGSWVRDTILDLTNIEELKIEWECDDGGSSELRSSFGIDVSDEGNTGGEIEKREYIDQSFTRQTTSLDVTEYEGGHHIHIILDNTHGGFFTTTATLKIHRVFTPKYELALNVSPSEAGTVTGEGFYVPGDNVSITGTTNAGYVFLSWEDEQNNLISMEQNFAFEMPAENTALTAQYEEVNAIPLSPVNEEINHTLDNVFDWEVNADQTHFELQHREQGVNTWETTGKVVSNTTNYIMPADTLLEDKDYEWRVKVWYEDPDELEGEWSDTVEFTTGVLEPIVSDPLPAENTEVEAGVINFSGVVTSPEREDIFFLQGGSFASEVKYLRKLKLHITIADNSLYSEADEYTTPFVNSGERIGIEHPITGAGIYYIKMQAEDAEGVMSETFEYQISVLHLLFFLEAPQVKTEGLQATHITVQSPTNSYTASLAGVDNDNKIERIVEIDEGDAATVEEVAGRLLDRWGSERKSVVGKVLLNTTFKFKDKVKIIYNEANIEEEMTLQKVEHNVTNFETTLTAGDIILSDNELLARILDEIGV